MVDGDQAVLVLQPAVGIGRRVGGLGDLHQQVPSMPVRVEQADVENADAVHIGDRKPVVT